MCVPKSNFFRSNFCIFLNEQVRFSLYCLDNKITSRFCGFWNKKMPSHSCLLNLKFNLARNNRAHPTSSFRLSIIAMIRPPMISYHILLISSSSMLICFCVIVNSSSRSHSSSRRKDCSSAWTRGAIFSFTSLSPASVK